MSGKNMTIEDYDRIGNEIKKILKSLLVVQCDFGLPKKLSRRYLEPAEKAITLFRAEMYNEYSQHLTKVTGSGRFDKSAEDIFYGFDLSVNREGSVDKMRKELIGRDPFHDEINSKSRARNSC
jgi:hypothetical protein